jgi:ActR/RegA family two-component response regulator
VIRAAEPYGIDEMARSNIAIIAAEVDPMRSTRLGRSLVLLGYQPAVASSAEEVITLIREGIYERAVVAAELVWEGRSIISRLCRLPSIQSVVAIGPTGDLHTEALARTAGASAYLARPVNIESLARALHAPADVARVTERNEKNATSP